MGSHSCCLIGAPSTREIKRQEILCFRKNMGLVYSVARRFLGRGVEMVGPFSQLDGIGLLKAVDHFDP